MPSATHILETALLLLVAFLVGASIGYLARRLTSAKPKVEVAVAAPTPLPTGPQLVVAPTIAPVAGTLPRRTAAERLAAAAARDAAEPPDPPISPTSAATPAPAVAPAAPEPVAATAESPAAETVAVPPQPVIEPSRTAGEATAGIVVPSPADILPSPPIAAAAPPVDPAEAVATAPPLPAEDDAFAVPPVEPEPLPESVTADAVPDIDETAQVVERPIADGAPQVVLDIPESIDAPPADLDPTPAASAIVEQSAPAAVEQLAAVVAAEHTAPAPAAEPEPAAPPDIPETLTEPPPVTRAAPASRTALEDDEFAAMRAIESGTWTPRRPAAPSRPVPHPEQAAATPEVDAAMANARSAVASATAAAAAAIAETAELARERQAVEVLAAAPLEFEPIVEAAPHSFLETAEAPAPNHVETSGLSFQNHPHIAFGRPAALSAPRDGRADNLKQIKGVTPQLESSLNDLGIYHFDQIAGWDQKALVWVDSHLALKGRIARDKWLDQARALSQDRGRPMRPVRR